ncbi:hypothetical protein GW17_00040083 [Ensete ventricosum]|nr:hypothetical protein GW17_00040083 [Ensete ventricosum]
MRRRRPTTDVQSSWSFSLKDKADLKRVGLLGPSLSTGGLPVDLHSRSNTRVQVVYPLALGGSTAQSTQIPRYEQFNRPD